MYFTEIELNELSKKIDSESDINKLKILLANEATTILHGSKAAKESADTATETFVKGGLGKSIPEKKISKKIILQGISIIELIFQNGLTQSKSEARRIIKNNGVKINDKTISDEKRIVSTEDFLGNNYIKLSTTQVKFFKNHLHLEKVY